MKEEPKTTNCQWCGNIHNQKCPMIKAIEYHQDGTTKRVEFYAPNDYGPITQIGPSAPHKPFPWENTCQSTAEMS
jgi:hypothetical protein